MDHLPLPPGRPLESRRARGNPTTPPVVRRIEHGPQLAAQLDAVTAELPPDVVEDEENDARVVLKLSATTRLQNGPLNRLQLTPLGEGEDWTYFVLSSRESRENLLNVLQDYTQLSDDAVSTLDWNHPKSWAQFVDNIDGLEVYGPEDRRDPSLIDLTFDTGVEVIDCLLWPAATQAASTQRVNDLTATVNEHADTDPRVRVAASDPRPDRTLVRVVATHELLGVLLDNVDVERIRGPLRASISTTDIARAHVPDEMPDAASTLIGVVDGVVNQVNPLTAPHVIGSKDFPTGHTFSGTDEHGTAVASVAIWGVLDSMVTDGRLATPHPVVSARVLDRAPNRDYQVTGLAHLTIEEAIRWLVSEHGVRVINLSINERYAATAPLRDELTVTIDSLARELQVVIVVSTGNRVEIGVQHWHDDYPQYLNDIDGRIAAPGDAALALTVGSHALRDVPATSHPEELTAIAAKNQPSPFTRTGPTRGVGQVGALKPEFSHHGGNWAWNHSFNQLVPREPGTSAIVAITPKGTRIVGSSNGTSYAAPAVAHEVARIAERYQNAGPNLLRALTALAAQPLNDAPATEHRYTAGYGVPDAERVLESETSRVILTYEGDAPTNTIVVHRLPIPEAFAEGVRDRIFRVALAFDPPVRRSRREYVAGSMTVELVRGLTLDEVSERYSRQPTRAAAEADPTIVRHSLPDSEHRPHMEPGVTVVESNTLIRREFMNGPWDPDHGDYFLVVAHNQSAWTTAQRSQYATQSYALAVEVGERNASSLDLYAAIRAQLRARGRGRIR